MLNSLQFVQGAVAKKDFIPELTHFRIQGGRIRGYNGMLGLSCPIDLNLDISPKAVPFIKAIQTCKDTIQLHVTPTGRLSIKSGKFKALVECTSEASIEIEPSGTVIDLSNGFLKVLKTLFPLIAEDASRPWARGILFRGSSAFATNNIILAEAWLGYDFPVEINIPKAAIAELLRIGEEPEKMQVSEANVTFHFTGDRWLRTQTYVTEWPDLTTILNRESKQVKIQNELWTAVEDLTPFVDELGRIFLSNDAISTGENDSANATVDFINSGLIGCFHFEQLRLLSKVAETADFTSYPAPCLFQGNNLRGAIVGMRY